jgi:hypothetical protein
MYGILSGPEDQYAAAPKASAFSQAGKPKESAVSTPEDTPEGKQKALEQLQQFLNLYEKNAAMAATAAAANLQLVNAFAATMVGKKLLAIKESNAAMSSAVYSAAATDKTLAAAKYLKKFVKSLG